MRAERRPAVGRGTSTPPCRTGRLDVAAVALGLQTSKYKELPYRAGDHFARRLRCASPPLAPKPSGAAVQAVEPRPAAAAARGAGGCGCPARAAGPAAMMEHVLLALRETEAEREARIRGVFSFFDAAGLGHLDHAQIVAGLAALRVPERAGGGGAEDYARALLRACDRDRDGRVGYDDFRRYMDDKELELYRIFQAIDVEHNGCILPEELWHALVLVEAVYWAAPAPS